MNNKIFECENCGRKYTADEVLQSNGDCKRCKDTIRCYTIDSAEYIVKLENEIKELKDELIVQFLKCTVKSNND